MRSGGGACCLPQQAAAPLRAAAPLLHRSRTARAAPPAPNLHLHPLMTAQVKCCECGYESNTYDPCIDLSLEITRAQSVRRALERFTAGEALDGANKYK